MKVIVKLFTVFLLIYEIIFFPVLILHFFELIYSFKFWFPFLFDLYWKYSSCSKGKILFSQKILKNKLEKIGYQKNKCFKINSSDHLEIIL